jgi:amino acid transporter
MRNISLIGAISIGIGGMVGGGIFAVLGEAVSLAHGATALAFFIAGIVAILTAYSYAKLSVTYQSEGGTVTFIDNAFGDNILSGSINLMLWLCYIVTISLYSTAFASYGATFFAQTTPFLKHILISGAIIVPALINLISSSFVEKSEMIIVIIKLSLLILIIIVATPYIEIQRLSTQNWDSSISIITAGMIIFVAYEGFELIANSAHEIKDPIKNLPIAFYSSVIIVIILYILISIVTVGNVSSNELIVAKDYALAIAAKPALGQTGFIIVSIAALLSTFSAINATIYGNARLGYNIAKDGKLPHKLLLKRRQIPFMGVVYTTIFSLILANSIDLSQIAIIGSAGFLLIFFIVNISAYKLKKQIKANRYILILASVFSFLALAILLVYTYKSNPNAIMIFMLFIIISLLFELIYGRFVRGHLFKREY